MTAPHDPRIITLVYDEAENRCRVDIGNIPPLIAATWLHDAANMVEDWTTEPDYVVIMNGVERVAVPEPEED
jgi:hypothetical protein